MRTIFDQNMNQVTEEAREHARRVMLGDYGDDKDIEIILRFYLSREYRIPLFDPYFENRTLYELVFETELVRLSKEPRESINKEIVKESKEEITELFSDWQETDTKKMDNDQFLEDAKKFMETSKFKGEDDDQE